MNPTHIQCPFKFRRAFSLVEILVVIAVIGVLSALIIAAVGSVRTKTDEVVCAGRLREIGGLIGAYVSDNDGHLPGPLADQRVCGWYSAATAWERGTIAGRLQPYMGTPDPARARYYPAVFQSPTVMRDPSILTRRVSDAGAGITKIVNSDVRREGSVAGSGYNPFGIGADRQVTVPPSTMFKVGQDISSAKVWAIRECDATNVSFGGLRPVPQQVVHGDTLYVLYFDGHVEGVDASEFPKD